VPRSRGSQYALCGNAVCGGMSITASVHMAMLPTRSETFKVEEDILDAASETPGTNAFLELRSAGPPCWAPQFPLLTYLQVQGRRILTLSACSASHSWDD
jgi:hypothetical protein